MNFLLLVMQITANTWLQSIPQMLTYSLQQLSMKPSIHWRAPGSHHAAHVAHGIWLSSAMHPHIPGMTLKGVLKCTTTYPACALQGYSDDLCDCNVTVHDLFMKLSPKASSLLICLFLNRRNRASHRGGGGGGHSLRPYSQQRPMRMNMSCCLGLCDRPKKSSNRLLVFVPHETPRGSMKSLEKLSVLFLDCCTGDAQQSLSQDGTIWMHPADCCTRPEPEVLTSAHGAYHYSIMG